jgi:Flp pilus assembly protein TadG
MALTSRISVARACLARFCADRSANIAPIFAIALVPVVSLTGSAVDYSRANNVKAAMQAATDATALNLVQKRREDSERRCQRNCHQHLQGRVQPA